MPAPEGWTQLRQQFPTSPRDFLGEKMSSTRSAEILSALLVNVDPRWPCRQEHWLLAGDTRHGCPHTSAGTLWDTRAHPRERTLGSGSNPMLVGSWWELLGEVSSPSLLAPLAPAALGGPGLGWHGHAATCLCFSCGHRAPIFLLLLVHQLWEAVSSLGQRPRGLVLQAAAQLCWQMDRGNSEDMAEFNLPPLLEGHVAPMGQVLWGSALDHNWISAYSKAAEIDPWG